MTQPVADLRSSACSEGPRLCIIVRTSLLKEEYPPKRTGTRTLRSYFLRDFNPKHYSLGIVLYDLP